MNDRSSIKSKDFKKKINRLTIIEKISQCSLPSLYVFFTKNGPSYFDDIYVPIETNGVHTRSSSQKLNVPRRKTNIEQKALSYVGPSLWNNLNKTLKTYTSIHVFKHNIKQD